MDIFRVYHAFSLIRSLICNEHPTDLVSLGLTGHDYLSAAGRARMPDAW